MLQITTGDARPIFRQIVDGLRARILTGELPPGHKLPSVRALAIELTVNPNTVAKAYTELTDEGLIETRSRVGVFVCEPRQRLSDAERQRRLDEALQRFVHDVASLGYDAEVVLERTEHALERLGLERGAEATSEDIP